MAETTRVEPVAEYPLSPMQQGLLFQSLRSSGPGTALIQIRGRFRERLDADVFEQAWQKVVDRHAIFRTAFHWENLPEPKQFVHERARITLTRQNWQKLPPDEQSARLDTLALEERTRGFDFSKPPLMRLVLVQLGASEFEFLWTLHHLLLDARAFIVVLNEVCAFYEGIKSDHEPQLPAPVPFQNFISWLQKQDWSRAQEFWSTKLNGFAAPTTLRTASSTRATNTSTYAEEKIFLSPRLSSALKSLAQENGFTVNTIVQGAWAVLLSRYSGEEDVVFGALRACRRSSVNGAESMVGLLINTVPVRVAVPPQMPALDWLKQLRAHWIELREFEHTPLIKAQACSGVPAGESLFETLLNVQEPSWEAVLESQGGAWKNRTFSIHNQPGYPLSVDAYIGPVVSLKITYDEARFDTEVIRRMLAHLQTILDGIAAQPNQPLVSLPLLTPGEEHQLLSEWNNTVEEFPTTCVHELFEAQAARAPKSLAIADAQTQLTYEQLNAHANALAQRLVSIGVKPDTLVGVLMERSAELVISELAVLKAGGAFVPLDPAYPQERLAFIIQDTAMPVILIQEKFKGLLPRNAPQAITVNAESAPSDPKKPVVAGASQTNLAYLIYTSGSTGTPKGVAIEHAGLANLVAWHQRTYSLTPQDRATVLASPAFDASVWEIWPYLAAGASLHIVPDKARLAGSDLVAWLAGNNITISFLPTPLAEQVLDAPWPKQIAMRALLTGGDKLNRLPPKGLPFKLYNLYGPTENTVVTTACLVSPDDGKGKGAPPIGRPIANTQTYILDQHLRLVPIGVPGELHVSGVGLARGYWGQPDLTAQKFIPHAHPFNSDTNARLYKTGDRACYRADGQIEFLGRIDHQVKIRGYRIELGEIEAVLVQHPSVREAVVLARNNRLIAYIVGAPKADTTELRRYLQSRLPDYMVPSVFVAVENFSLTPNGKIDRKALPEPTNAEPGESFVALKTPTEELLAAIYSELLHVDKVSAHADFFELGGHSLLVTQAVSRIRALFQVELPFDALFENPRLDHLARQIDSLIQISTTDLRTPKLAQSSSSEPVLSSAQERLWFLEQLEPGRPIYNIPLAFEVSGPIDHEALRNSLSEIVRRHAPLRTHFKAVTGRPVAVIQEQANVAIDVVDLRHSADPEQEVQRLLQEEAIKPFNLSQDLMLRAKLYRVKDDQSVLFVCMHHIASDGWSVEIFLRELTAFYVGRVSSPGVPLPCQYSDFARWQHEWLDGDAAKKQLAYWKQQLFGKLPALNLPTDHPRPPVQTYRGATHQFELGADLSNALQNFGRTEGVTLFMTVLASLQALLHRYSGQEDILIGSPVAGRTHAEVENLIGPFVNTLVFRANPSGEKTFHDFLGEIRKTALEAYASQDLPFEKLVETLSVERDLSRSPVFQVMLVLQNMEHGKAQESSLRLTPRHLHTGTAKFDLSLVLEDGPQGLHGYLEYNTDLFEPETAANLIGHLGTLLSAAIKNPQQPIRDLPLLGEPERQRLLVDWNQTQVEIPEGICIHQVFEAQSAKTPDAVAVIFEDKQLTYAELNCRANHVAQKLQALGIGPESLVGICIERSPEMITGMLGILKAGATYVPLDPGYPKDRLQYMVEDSKISVLLTQEKFAKDFQMDPKRIFCLDRMYWPAEQTVPLNSAKPNNLAYVIYTSGSTGKPKGVMLAHRNVINFFTGMDKVLGTEPGVWLAVTSMCFDISVLELLWTLCRGFKVVIQADERASQVSARKTEEDYSIPAQIERHHVTHFQCTPSLATMLLQEPKAPEALAQLKYLLLGGEALPASLVSQLKISGRIINMYGPTETTVWSTSCPVELDQSGVISIGRPIANTQVYILDDQLQPVPRGVPGELFIGGMGVARGYLNRPDLTAQRFVPNPFIAGERLYRTGDLARYLPDGRIEFLGRVDHQVKLRGFRIELGEIEAALRERDDIRECVVVLREISADDKRLVAYYVANGTPKTIELRRHLQGRLPDYMVPSIFVALEKLPLTPNGKIDRKALPAPQLAASENPAIPPQTDTEKTIAGVWRELLRVEQVGLNDNFFDLGGHSLLMVQVQARLSDLFSVNLPVLTLFQYPTISALAKHLSEGTKATPLSHVQDRARRQRASFSRATQNTTTEV